jgi:tetratricopeptide (TPR) repeat protein
LYVLGMAAFKTGRFELAVRMICRAIAVNERQPFFHANLGNALRAQGKTDEAVASLERALAINPNHVEACFNLGNIYFVQKKYDEAAACFKRAVGARPEYADAWCNLGNVLKTQRKLDEAVDSYNHALALLPDHADLYCNLGDALHLRGNLDEAMACFKRTMALNPEHTKACNCLGNAYFDKGMLKESVAHCARAVELNPEFYDAQMNVSLLQLLQGEYLAGWRNYEVRWKVYPARQFEQPLWQGAAALDGPGSPAARIQGRRILLHTEQGLGDALQFLRYVPLVHAAGGTVVLDVPPRLRRLAAQLPGVAALVTTGDVLPAFDCQCPLMSLPQAFGTTLESIPARVPYLAAPAEALQTAARLPWHQGVMRIGLAWTGNATHPKNWARSIPLAMLEPLFRLDGAHFFSLQLGPGVAELATVKADITDLAPVTGDMADTAAQMAHLDLILTIDTSIAHLAGALARPTWLLLPALPDWRWLLDREDSPWYPTVRLFRQPKAGDWQSVVNALEQALSATLAVWKTRREQGVSTP